MGENEMIMYGEYTGIMSTVSTVGNILTLLFGWVMVYFVAFIIYPVVASKFKGGKKKIIKKKKK